MLFQRMFVFMLPMYFVSLAGLVFAPCDIGNRKSMITFITHLILYSLPLTYVMVDISVTITITCIMNI